MQMTIEETVDLVSRRIFQVTLMPPSLYEQNLVYLEHLAYELNAEGRPLLITTDLLGRLLIERFKFCSKFDKPLEYLVACYKRAVEEHYKCALESQNVKKMRIEILELFSEAKKLALICAEQIFRDPGLFSQYEHPSLLHVVLNTADPGFQDAVIPPEFLDHMFNHLDRRTLDTFFQDFRALVCIIPFVHQFQKPLNALGMLVSSCPLAAKILVHHSTWHPKGNHVNGRDLENLTFLGAFFRINVIPNSDASTYGEDMPSKSTIQATMHQLYDGLHKVLLALLDSPETQEHVLELLADIVEKNASRAHTRVDFSINASTGMFVSLSVVMLKLCKTFSRRPGFKMVIGDLNYVLRNGRVNFTNLTAIHATSEERAEWVDKQCAQMYSKEGFAQDQLRYEQDKIYGLQSKDSSPLHFSEYDALFGSYEALPTSSAYSLDCECFFLAARVLHLGLLQALYELKKLERKIVRSKASLNKLKALREFGQFHELKEAILKSEATIEKMMLDKYCYEAQLKDTGILRLGMTYYELMFEWFVSPFGGFRDTLPASCPMQFASIPEHFVEDAMDFLTFTASVPNAMHGIMPNNSMSFIVMFIWSPHYVKNPYLRAKMVKVLNAWMLLEINSPRLASPMFGEHHLARRLLVPNLLRLYVDIECAGNGNDKYVIKIKHEICELLKYLWTMPSHQETWKSLALREKNRFYLKFLNLLINDITFLLDTSFQHIRMLKEVEVLQIEGTMQIVKQAKQVKQDARTYMTWANQCLKMLCYTTLEITSSLLVPEMVGKVASMLNYFLLQLVCKSEELDIKQPNECGFNPQLLLVQVAQIYVNIASGDRHGIFAKAICTDNMSYRDELISKAIVLLRSKGHENSSINKFEDLGRKVAIAADKALVEEAMLGEIPDEFLDPIQCTLMIDPVILPSSKATIDRTTIQRHLLSDQTDPFNRSLLTPDMLIPNVQLKAMIDEFFQSSTKKRKR